MVALPLALISYGQAVLLGLLQGVSELFPISSLGHSVIVPQLLGWDIHQNDSFFITFLVATHLATALVLLAFFRRDWARILRGLGRSLRNREIGDDSDARLGWLLVVGTVPAGLLGLLLEHALRDLFASARSAAFFLILNGFMLYGAERLRRRAPAARGRRGRRAHRPPRVLARRARSRRGAGDRAHPRLLSLRRDHGRRPAGRALQRGLRALRLPARDADHRRGGAAQAARTARLERKRRARPGARRSRCARRSPHTSRCAS